MRIRSATAAVGVVIGLALGPGLGAPALAQTETKDARECAVIAQAANTGARSSYLFVFDGRKAQLKPVGGNARTLELTVPLRKTNHLVTWFTDRPERDAGHMSMATFTSLWQEQGDNTFKNDPPNVAISFDNKTLIATMTNPKIITTKGGGQAFKSTMTLIDDSAIAKLSKNNKNLATHAKRAGANTHSRAQRLEGVSVFVDNSCFNCETNQDGVLLCCQQWCDFCD